MILRGRNDKRWYLKEQDGVDVLWVFQEKLSVSLPDDKCWKPIPIYYPEQREAYSICLKAEADQPLNKTIQKYTTGHITSYAGRKGFTDLMLGKGHSLEDIAQWMGYTSIQTTWSKYKSRTKLRLVSIK